MIKFRAWDKVQNKMLLPDNIEFIHGQAYWAEASTDGQDEYANDGRVDGISALFELEQFTGLKDTSGKDIYEGDVLRTKAGLIQIVEQGILETDREDIISGFYANNLSDDKPHTFSYDDEVIGNAHENPELLEE
ncbi:YopX family protein [Lactiplantibacillus plantarum]|uniref:YopX family protein n=1 Tax=Lactiplantibacillus plantarum TaxID=1590 RepID=UPI00237ECDD1|nr:YopX family protein [Lactiplantibacillus plantarum]WDT52049.1 YopX family protein [Lactiplantibacillus plantarum]